MTYVSRTGYHYTLLWQGDTLCVKGLAVAGSLQSDAGAKLLTDLHERARRDGAKALHITTEALPDSIPWLRGRGFAVVHEPRSDTERHIVHASLDVLSSEDGLDERDEPNAEDGGGRDVGAPMADDADSDVGVDAD